MSTSSLNTLPVELLHRVLDHVDTETVFLSFRNACKYFHTIISSYNQYKLDFRSITKSTFHRLCRFIQPENVVSLILSDDHRTTGQIKLFLSLFNIHTFTRLRSLTLIDVDDSELIAYLNHVRTYPVVSLSIAKRCYTQIITKCQTTQLLMNCPIQHLSLNQSSTIERVFNILFYFPCLKTLQLDGIIMLNNNQNSTDLVTVKSNLKSLTINFYSSDLDMIISVLPCTPYLMHLKLIGCPMGSALAWDGYWWAEFIPKNLPQLQYFEFFFNKLIGSTQSTSDIESIIIPFRTSFWLEKRWHITCDYYKHTRELNLYSIPICKSTILYRSLTDKISCSNSTNETPYIMDNICSLILNSISTTSLSTLLSNRPLFTRVTKLTLVITDKFSNDSVEYLSNLVDLPHVNIISLAFDLYEQSLNAIKTVVNSLFDRTCNVQSIHFRSTRLQNCVEYLKIISPIIPNRVKNLTIDVVNANDIQWILDRFQSFSSITFQSKTINSVSLYEISENLEKKGKKFTHFTNHRFASFWFD